MPGFLERLAGKRDTGSAAEPRAIAPAVIEVDGVPPFDLAAHMERHEGFPFMDWKKVLEWMEATPEEQRSAAWSALSHGWRLHLRDALGPAHRVDRSEHAAIVSSLEPPEAQATLEFMERTRKRIVNVLAGVAQVPDDGVEMLLVFDDEDAYYRYVSRFYPDSGEFAFSSGMHIHDGASYYVTTKADLRSIEPVIAHEMTHGSVAHLSLPLWLNEGLAVNTEHRVAAPGHSLYTPVEMRAKHLKFWGAAEIQEFWSGRSFQRPDDGNMLSYDLARILVEQLSADWPPFAAFANAANYSDGGAEAARQHLGVELGALAAALLEREPAERYQPQPDTWKDAPDHVPSRPSAAY